VKLLHTSDWHLGKNLYEHSLLEDQAHFLDWLLRLMEEEQVEALVIAGDVYHRSVPPADAIALYDQFLNRAILKLGIPVLTVAGNHDSGARLEFAGELLGAVGYHVAGKPRQELARVTLNDRHGPVVFWLLPYLFPADVRALLPKSDARTFQSAYEVLLGENLPLMDKGVRNVMVAHGLFAGQEPVILSESEWSVGGMDAVSAAIFQGFDYTALGHLHAPQKVGEKVRYSGSPLKYSLSEEHQRKSVSLVELGAPGSPVQIREIPVPALHDVRRIAGRFDDLMNPIWHENKNFEDYVFAEISDEGVLYAMEKLRTLFPRLLGVSLPFREMEGEAVQIGAVRERMTMEQHFARFYQETAGEELPEEHRAVLRELIEALEEEKREVYQS